MKRQKSRLTVALLSCILTTTADAFMPRTGMEVPSSSQANQRRLSFPLDVPNTRRGIPLHLLDPAVVQASMNAGSAASVLAADPTVVQASAMAVESNMLEESFVESVVALPAVWSAAVMVTLVGLLEAWEKTMHYARTVTPPAVRKVLDDLVGEVSSLGFIGLVLTFVLSKLALGDAVGEVSRYYLGNEEALLEDFHFWHETFFQAAITFCFSAAVMVLQVIRTVKEVSDLAEEQLRKHKEGSDEADDEVAMEEYESLLKLQHPDETESVLRHELTLTQAERGAEALIIRARLEREFNLPANFRIEQAIEYALSGDRVNFFKIKPA